MGQDTNTRFLELDAFRGIAALMVAAYHYLVRYDELFATPVDNGIAHWAWAGQFGVDFFFVISGFVIIWSVQRSRNPLRFALARFARLFPVYWVAVTTTFLLVRAFRLEPVEQDLHTYLVNLTMLQGHLRVTEVDGVYWSLSVELNFYFLVFLLLLFGLVQRIELVVSVLIVFVAVEQWVGLAWLGGYGHELVSELLFTEFIALFLAGISFYRLWTGEARWLDRVNLVLTLCLNALLLPWQAALVILCCYLAFLLAVTGRLRWLCVRPLLAVGAVSYPFYLVHQYVGFLVMRETLSRGVDRPLAVLAALAVTLSLAGLIHAGVEKPLTPRFRRWLNGLVPQRLLQPGVRL